MKEAREENERLASSQNSPKNIQRNNRGKKKKPKEEQEMQKDPNAKRFKGDQIHWQGEPGHSRYLL